MKRENIIKLAKLMLKAEKAGVKLVESRLHDRCYYVEVDGVTTGVVCDGTWEE